MLSISIHNNGVNVILAHDLLPRGALSSHNFGCVFFFFDHQFITWSMVVDYSKYIVPT